MKISHVAVHECTVVVICCLVILNFYCRLQFLATYNRLYFSHHVTHSGIKCFRLACTIFACGLGLSTLSWSDSVDAAISNISAVLVLALKLKALVFELVMLFWSTWS